MKGFLWYAGAAAVVIALVGALFYIRPELLMPESLPAEEPVTAAECTADTDCASAGCSGQICTTTEKAPNIITTCEFRDEWSCLAKTSCGCVKNKCQWKDNSEYRSCMDQFKQVIS